MNNQKPLINGEPLEHLDVSDRAIAYGDGCFTTIAKVAGDIQLLEAHINRLKKGCLVLNIMFSNWENLKRQIINSAKSHSQTVVKVIISRGSGGRGYSTEGTKEPVTIISLHSFPQHYEQWNRQGISLGLSSVKLSKQKMWDGVKHLNRLEQVFVKREASKYENDEIVCDADDIIVEASSANIFWKVGGQWFTSDLRFSGINGVMRNQWLAVFEHNNIKVNVVRAHFSLLIHASDIFICNSLIPFAFVHTLQLKTNHQKDRIINTDREKLQKMITESLTT